MLNRALIAQYLWFTALKGAAHTNANTKTQNIETVPATLKSRIAAAILDIYYKM